MRSLKEITKGIGSVLYQNGPQILTGLACAGVVSTTILGIKASFKAKEVLDSYNTNFRDADRETKIEILKDLGRTYGLTILSGAATIGCVIGAQHINSKRAAALASLYSISKEALQAYQTKVIETIGAKAEKSIREEVSQETIRKHPVDDSNNVYITAGSVLCYDPHIDKYFYTEYEKIRAIVNTLNHRLISEMFIDLNEFYYELGLKAVQLGTDTGWYIDKGLIDMKYDTALTDDGRPCIVLNYNVEPRTEYV